MQKNNTVLSACIIYTAVFFAALIGVYENKIPIFPVQDPFHNGEFLAAVITVIHGASVDGFLPFTIHGAVDIWPALFVNLVMPERDMLLANTLLLYPIFTIIAVVFTAMASIRLALIFRIAPVMMVPFILIAGLCLGWRDALFALSLYLFTYIIPDDGESGGGFGVQILFGLVVAFGAYWSFNRGAVTLIAFGLPILWLSTRDRRYAVSIAATVLCFLIIGSIAPGVGIRDYFENFLMLLQTSSQWSYPRTLSRDLWWVLTVGMTACAIGVAVLRVSRDTHSEAQLVLISALLIASVIYMKIGVGRVDQTHVVMGVWLPLLVITLLMPSIQLSRLSFFQFGCSAIGAVLIAYITRHYIAILPIAATVFVATAIFVGDRGRRYFVQAMMVLCTSVVMLGVGNIWVDLKNGNYAWLKHPSNLPRAEEAVTPGIRWSAQLLRDSGAHCVFDLVNVGLVNAVANLPACSRFTYPVYAGPQHESQLISDLQRAAPAAILYKGDFWSYAIDGKKMSSRFPSLDAEILREYPREECNLGFCIRFKK